MPLRSEKISLKKNFNKNLKNTFQKINSYEKIYFPTLTFFFRSGIRTGKNNGLAKGQMPNSKGMPLKTEEKTEELYRSKETEMFAFLPPKEERKQMAVIVIPGGGYYKLTYDLGGYQIAKWFNTQGISAFVLNYRLPTSPDLRQREIAPLQDVQAAIKYLRKNAEQYGISPEQIGVIGTSAGGHWRLQ
jgi:acetyl esterase/lipase